MPGVHPSTDFFVAICSPHVLHLEKSTTEASSVRSRDIAKKAKVLGNLKKWKKQDMEPSPSLRGFQDTGCNWLYVGL